MHLGSQADQMHAHQIVYTDLQGLVEAAEHQGKSAFLVCGIARQEGPIVS